MTTLSLDSKYNPGLSRFFSPGVLNDLLRKGSSSLLDELAAYAGLNEAMAQKVTLGDLLQRVYKHLCLNYRSEYIYKNAIANKILLGKHSLNTSFMLTEFRVDDCKADAVVINGTSNVYEIKSEFDSMERLHRQIAAYEKAFDMVHVITAPSQIEKVQQHVPMHVGIITLNERHNISTIREAKSRKGLIEPGVVFDSLRKEEYTAVVKEHFGFIPAVPNTQIYKVCRELFCKLPPEAAHDGMVKALKKRGQCKALKEFIETSPECLRAYTLNSGLKDREFLPFKELLKIQYKSLIKS
ncbi:MAG: sce7726 family protein [Deltaproteobacteria bacterium]|nr:sce7726 family protein [Deltaproteobacteria bacterium]